jgi:hypothetical protein
LLFAFLSVILPRSGRICFSRAPAITPAQPT